MRLFPVVTALVIGLSGCAAGSSNMSIGTDQSLVSLKDQREATSVVKKYASIPAGANLIGRVDASRCHRYQGSPKPTEADVEIDLKVVAYGKGADGIADVKFTSGVGLARNCWGIITGEAQAFSFPK